jgi:hypothetical protein
MPDNLTAFVDQSGMLAFSDQSLTVKRKFFAWVHDRHVSMTL